MKKMRANEQKICISSALYHYQLRMIVYSRCSVFAIRNFDIPFECAVLVCRSVSQCVLSISIKNYKAMYAVGSDRIECYGCVFAAFVFSLLLWRISCSKSQNVFFPFKQNKSKWPDCLFLSLSLLFVLFSTKYIWNMFVFVLFTRFIQKWSWCCIVAAANAVAAVAVFVFFSFMHICKVNFVLISVEYESPSKKPIV